MQTPVNTGVKPSGALAPRSLSLRSDGWGSMQTAGRVRSHCGAEAQSAHCEIHKMKRTSTKYPYSVSPDNLLSSHQLQYRVGGVLIDTSASCKEQLVTNLQGEYSKLSRECFISYMTESLCQMYTSQLVRVCSVASVGSNSLQPHGP